MVAMRSAGGEDGRRAAKGGDGDELPPESTLNRQAAYRRFQQELLGGAIRPGQNLSQRDLVTRLGVSLGALRELLPRLEAEGLLQVLPQRGIQIRTVDLRLIREAYQMRMAYEREATIAAIDGIADEPLHQQRQMVVDLMRRAEQGISGALLAEAQAIDTGFHEFLINATNNDLMVQAYAINAIQVRMIQLDRIRLNPVVLAPALADHLEIIDGILARDRARAVEAMERHIHNARSRAVSFA
jgi:DNA-binding GntR family transcriptional regulator